MRTPHWSRCKEVMNHFNRMFNLYKPFGFLFQKNGDGGHGIGIEQCVTDCSHIARIASKQCGICPMQCCDDAGLVFRGQHCACQNRSGSMWHGIMYMQDIETM